MYPTPVMLPPLHYPSASHSGTLILQLKSRGLAHGLRFSLLTFTIIT